MGYEEKGSGFNKFRWSSYEKSNYKPAIVCGETGLGRPFSSSPLIGRELAGKGPRNIRRHKTGDCHSLLSCCQEETSRSKALDLMLLAKKGDFLIFIEGSPIGCKL